jgi:RNA polymerase sigma-70 factor (ECF subfamily)
VSAVKVGDTPKAARARGPEARPRDPPAGEDAELIARTVDGNLAALGVLYDRHHEALRRYVLRHTASSHEADDVVHDVFLTVPRAGAIFDGRSSALPFLTGIANQVMRERGRKRARLLRVLRSFSDILARVVSRTPEDATDDAREVERLLHAIAALSEEKRTVLLMMEREGLSGEEIAAALGIPVATVWTRLHYARAELRSALENRRPKRRPR